MTRHTNYGEIMAYLKSHGIKEVNGRALILDILIWWHTKIVSNPSDNSCLSSIPTELSGESVDSNPSPSGK
jgi:hypothetical protein